MTYYFIMVQPLPTDRIVGWYDMNFVKVNDYPVPFKSREDAQEYMKAWSFEEPQYTIWEVTCISGK